jgi:uncharacterized protein YuzE
MEIRYNPKADLLYIRLDDRKQEVINRRSTEDVVLDIGADNQIIGIEILDFKTFESCRSIASQIPGLALARCTYDRRLVSLCFASFSNPSFLL